MFAIASRQIWPMAVVLGAIGTSARAVETPVTAASERLPSAASHRDAGRPTFATLLRAKEAVDRLPSIQDAGITGWEWLGPGNIGGRVRAILPLSANTILVGAAAGGIWRSTDAGDSWSPVNDFLASLAVSSIVRDPFDGRLYAGTGEGFLVDNVRIDGSAGAGVYQSIDGGQTWTQIPSTASWALDDNDKFVNRVAARNLCVLAATNGGIHRSCGGPFVKTFDRWTTDVKWTSGNSAVAGLMTFCTDIDQPDHWNDTNECVIDPDSLSADIICAVYSHDAGLTWTASNFYGQPADTLDADFMEGTTVLEVSSTTQYEKRDIIRIGNSPGEQAQVSGVTGTTLTIFTALDSTYLAGTPVTLVPAKRTELAVFANDPNIVYASMGAGLGTIWKSTDGGQNFQFVSNPDVVQANGGKTLRGFLDEGVYYRNTIWVAPDNDSLLVVGGVELYRSTNGGVDFIAISNRALNLTDDHPHLDHHVVVEEFGYGPGNRAIYSGNDGGVHRANDIETVTATSSSGEWENLNHGLGVTQFYGGAATTSPTVEWFLGAGQDTGHPQMRLDNGASLDVNKWRYPYNRSGDDNYRAAIDASDPENPIFYFSSIDPRIAKSTPAGSTFVLAWQPPSDEERGRLFAPFLLDPNNPKTLLAGAKRIWRSTNEADTFHAIKDSLPDNVQASALDIAPSDPNTYWVGYDNGALWRTHQGADPDTATVYASWTDVSIGGQVAGRVINDIAINPTNRDEVFVAVALDPAGDVDTVWYTGNGGLCWEKRVGSPPYELPPIRVHTTRIDPKDPNRVFIGTDLGVLASADRGLTWNKSPLHPNGPDNDGPSHDGPANVEVWDLFWQGDQNLCAATNGRGMFRAAITPRGPLFDDISLSSETDDSGNSQGAAWGDYDGDGDLDLYVANHIGATNRMYRNDGGGSFSDASFAPLNLNVMSIGAAWADYDNDDDLDLMVANAGGTNALFNSAGTPVPEFLNATGAAGVAHNDDSRSVAWADYDNDGYLDLYIVNVGANRLYLNDRDNTFTDVSATSVAADSGSGQAAAFGDYDNDRDPDLYVTNWSSEANKLFRNDDGTFTDVSDSLGTGGAETSNGAAWGDYDNDGDLDLYVVNNGPNKLYRNDGALGFADVSAASGTDDASNGRSVAWVDYDNDGDLDLYVSNFLGANKLYRNECCDGFTDVSAQSGMDDASGHRSATCGDFDRDGSVDLYVTSSGANKLYRNFGDAPEGHHWLQVGLLGTQSNRNGIGARVRVVSGCDEHPRTQIREIASGSGLYSQNSLTADFGLGSDSVADTLQILWPSGVQQVFTGVLLDRKIVVAEDCTDNCVPTDTGVSPGTPARYALHVNRPNPFNPVTTILYDLPRKSHVRLHVYDVAGRLVRVLVGGIDQAPGRHRAIWRGRDDAGREAPSGIYFYRLDAGSFRDQRKMLLLR